MSDHYALCITMQRFFDELDKYHQPIRSKYINIVDLFTPIPYINIVEIVNTVILLQIFPFKMGARQILLLRKIWEGTLQCPQIQGVPLEVCPLGCESG